MASSVHLSAFCLPLISRDSHLPFIRDPPQSPPSSGDGGHAVRCGSGGMGGVTCIRSHVLQSRPSAILRCQVSGGPPWHLVGLPLLWGLGREGLGQAAVNTIYTIHKSIFPASDICEASCLGLGHGPQPSPRWFVEYTGRRRTIH